MRRVIATQHTIVFRLSFENYRFPLEASYAVAYALRA